jgi:seryl-tRNA synthetase
LAKKKELTEKKESVNKTMLEKEAEYKSIVVNIGNIVHTSCVESMDEVFIFFSSGRRLSLTY